MANTLTFPRLKSALEKQTGKTVILERKVDPTLIGGVVAQVGDLVFDGSVKNQLEQMISNVMRSSSDGGQAAISALKAS